MVFGATCDVGRVVTSVVYVEWVQGSGSVEDADFSPDSGTVAIVCQSGRVALYDCGSGACVQTLYEEGRFSTCRFSPDGRYLAVVGRDVHVHDLHGVRASSLVSSIYMGCHAAVVFTPDPVRLCCVSQAGLAQVWSAASRSVERTYDAEWPFDHRYRTLPHVAATDGRYLAVGPALKVWERLDKITDCP